MQLQFDIHDLMKDRLLTPAASAFMSRLSADLRFVGFVAVRLDDWSATLTAAPEPSEVAEATEEIPRHIAVMLEMFYCRCVDNFLTYVSDLLRAILKVQPAIIASTEKITTERILKARSLEEIVDDLIDEQVAGLSRKGFKELCDWFDKRGLRLCPEIQDMREMTKAIAIRNLVVHNRGRVDARFNRNLPQFNRPRGERLEITFADVISMMFAVGKTVSYFDIVAAKKFSLANGPYARDS